MLPKRRTMTDAPTHEVRGGFPVHFHYTVGIVGEIFFNGLKEKKLLGVTCKECSTTYFPPRMYCEECFTELTDEEFKVLEQQGTIESFTKTYKDHRGNPLAEPYFLALIKIKGSDTVFFHRLINVDEPKIGMTVKPVWNETTKASLFDIVGFEPA